MDESRAGCTGEGGWSKMKHSTREKDDGTAKNDLFGYTSSTLNGTEQN